MTVTVDSRFRGNDKKRGGNDKKVGRDDKKYKKVRKMDP